MNVDAIAEIRERDALNSRIEPEKILRNSVLQKRLDRLLARPGRSADQRINPRRIPEPGLEADSELRGKISYLVRPLV